MPLRQLQGVISFLSLTEFSRLVASVSSSHEFGTDENAVKPQQLFIHSFELELTIYLFVVK